MIWDLKSISTFFNQKPNTRWKQMKIRWIQKLELNLSKGQGKKLIRRFQKDRFNKVWAVLYGYLRWPLNRWRICIFETTSDFIRKIKELGFKEKDAEILFETKLDWDSITLNSDIHCVERACKFSTKMGDSCLTRHCVDEHQWGQYECNYDNCSYIAYSKEWLLRILAILF